MAGVREIQTEICIVGGGPAGAVSGLRLAQLGRQVCLLEGAQFPRAHVGESLTPSVWPILQMLGLGDNVARAGILPSTGSILHWGGAFERRGAEAQAKGGLVDRGRFDAALLSAAKDAGVRVLQPAKAYRPVRNPDGWTIPVRSDAGETSVRARMLIDAAGRQAGLGRKFRAPSPPLLALYAYWDTPSGFGAHTRVEAGTRHWFWGAALPNGRVNAMVFLDPADCTGLSPGDRRDLYLNLLSQSALLSPCLEHRRIGPVRRCDATGLQERTAPSADLLRVGEASFCVDPLSSQGVQLAMGQAVQCAVVANTVLARPDDRQLALDFYRDRQTERVQTHARLAAEFYAKHARVSDAGFWSERAQTLEWLRPQSSAPVPDKWRNGQPAVLSTDAQLAIDGIQSEAFIEPGTVLRHPNLPRPVGNLDAEPLAPLIGRLSGSATRDQIITSWSDLLPAERAGRFADWMWFNGILQAP